MPRCVEMAKSKPQRLQLLSFVKIVRIIKRQEFIIKEKRVSKANCLYCLDICKDTAVAVSFLFIYLFIMNKLRHSAYLCTPSGSQNTFVFCSVCPFQTIFPKAHRFVKIAQNAKDKIFFVNCIYLCNHRKSGGFIQQKKLWHSHSFSNFRLT